MPLTHFLALILGVVLLAGISLLAAQIYGVPMVWLAIGALVLAALVRGFAWR